VKPGAFEYIAPESCDEVLEAIGRGNAEKLLGERAHTE
jgi:hypothetical protein